MQLIVVIGILSKDRFIESDFYIFEDNTRHHSSNHVTWAGHRLGSNYDWGGFRLPFFDCPRR